MSVISADGFFWFDAWIETHKDVWRAVRDICRLSQEGFDVSMMAIEFIDDYGTYLDHLDSIEDDGRKVAKDNIGWMAGDEPPALRKLIFELFECEHPVTGKAVDLTPEEAFKAGKRWALNHSMNPNSSGVSDTQQEKEKCSNG